MKMHGEKVEGINTEIIAIPRSGKGKDGKPIKDIIFKAGPILDFTEFEKICPEPKPPFKVLKGGHKEYNLKDATYLEAAKQFAERKTAWIILKSLQYTEWLEWETVDFGNHRTWPNYKKELKDAGFSTFEVDRITNGVFTANGLNELRVQEARDAFLHGPEETVEQPSGPSTEPDSGSSGTPANDGA